MQGNRGKYILWLNNILGKPFFFHIKYTNNIDIMGKLMLKYKICEETGYGSLV